MDIEVKEGETLVEALTRRAKEEAKNAPETSQVTEPLTIAGAKKKAKKSNRPSGAINAKDVGGDPNDGAGEEVEIFSAVHIYQRAGEQEARVRSNARHEREMHGPNTLIFCHLHVFGAKCNSSCTARVGSET